MQTRTTKETPGKALAPATGSAGADSRRALIEESHQRCAALGLSRIERPDYEPLMRSDLAIARERNRRLSDRAAPVMEMLLEQIVNTHSMIVLTDAQGTVLHTVGDDDFLERAGKVALAPGANWAEHSKGTNAIGTALFAETPTLVHASEHFMHANSFLTCSAAPIFDPRGNMLGVLDVTGDHRSYHQHTMGLVRMSARMIENHWLTDDYTDRLRLHFHSRSEFIGTLLEGIVVVGPDGRVLGANRSALDQIGQSMAAVRNHSLTSLFGTSTAAVHDHLRSPLALPMLLHLPDGRPVHVSPRASGPVSVMLRGLGPAVAAAAAIAAGGLREPAEGAPARRASGLEFLQTGDPQVEAVVGKLRRVLNRDIPILILGETGTGKELLARAIHQDSERAKQAFVAVNCASIPETLIEAELFGYEEGAFTGAKRKGSHGRIVQANGGTLFLDEIGDMPGPLQARLLRVLQERSVTPLGSHKTIPVDIAVIGATHRPLREMIERGQFREDLYYRLNGLAVRLPALRERNDLPALARRILRGECPQHTPEISPAVMTMFTRYRWPGNVRQLANVLRTAAVMAAGEPQITEAHLPDDFLDDLQRPAAALAPLSAAAAPAPAAGRADDTAAAGGAVVAGNARTLQEAEIAMIQQVLDACDGNISEASKRLGISRNTIYRKLRWNPDRPDPARA
ncbi:sigma-54-dependent Fis family transcriptional regulator [Piscinibacter sakaiensis]|uniref:sigma-54-dependent Fis family transcriptional regulator n=1 Tax=Piscinibacter sakaiensis TaxID=1547922 RepID=UPI0037287F1B